MIPASDLRPGIRYERGFCRVVDANYHAGGGKLAGTVHAKLEELGGGAVIERRFRPDERLDRVELERARWQYIYADGDELYFMNPQTFEQTAIARRVLGGRARFLRPDMSVNVESWGAGRSTSSSPRRSSSRSPRRRSPSTSARRVR